MSKLVTVVGATGVQGGSVVRALLADSKYTLRAITRSKTGERAQSLQAQGVEVVEADANDLASLVRAFAGSYAIFAVTNFFEPLASLGIDKAMEVETKQGINLATAAAATPSLEHYIWSTLPNSRRVSDGKVAVPYYESKNKVDQYLESHDNLLTKTTFLWVSIYASNLRYPFFRPFTLPTTSDPMKLYQIQSTPAETLNTMAGDVTVNVGLFVAAILAQPEKTQLGKTVLVSTETMTASDVLATWAQVQGKESQVLTVEPSVYFKMWPVMGELMHLSASYW